VKERRPEDRLRDANPVPIEDVPPSSSPQGRALLSRIVLSPREEQAHSKRRRYALILVPIAIAAAVGAGLKWFRPATQRLVVVCYAGPSLGADKAVVSASSRGDSQACAALWQIGGQFGVGGNGTVPPLAACVLPSGGVGVFPTEPGKDVCTTLGLADLGPTGGAGDENQELIMVQDAVVPRLLARCVDRSDAVALVRSELDRHGLKEWRVVVDRPFSASVPCASFAEDVPHRTVVISPVPNSPSP
jgi:hypothetical protein